MAPGDEFIIGAGIILLALLFSPVFIAFARDHRYRWVIFGLSVATGWTAIGWAAAFAWAVWPGQGRVTKKSPPAEPPELAKAPEGDPYEQLARLGKLKAAAAITDAEFQAEKRRILGS